MTRTSSTPPFDRRGTWLFLGALAALTVAFGVLWLVWGFRWPPTAAVVTGAEPGDDRVVLEGRVEESTRRNP